MSREQHKVQAEIMQAYREIFLHTPQGQTIFKDMLKSSGLYSINGVRPSEDEEQINRMIIGGETNVDE